jgi:hypothetical protein
LAGRPAVQQSDPVTVDLRLVGAVMKNDIASVKLNAGPPLSAVTRNPSSSKSTVITLPAAFGEPGGERMTLSTFEFEKIET